MNRLISYVIIISYSWILPLSVHALGSPVSRDSAEMYSTPQTDSTTYCPQTHAYIQMGMTQDEVISACGQPTQKTQLNTPLMKKIPITQLVYTTVAPSNPYPSMTNTFNTQWSLPVGSDQSFSLEINIQDKKVKDMRLNGTNTNAISVCQGNRVSVGDNESQVYFACGSPQGTNQSYINVPIPSKKLPEVWTYQLDQYQPSFHLTFINGRLESIN